MWQYFAAAAALKIGSSFLSNSSAYDAAKMEAEALRKKYENMRKQNLYQAQIAIFNRSITLQNLKNLGKEEDYALQEVSDKGTNVAVAQQVAGAGAGLMAGGSMSEIQKTTMWQNSIEAEAIRNSYSTGKWDLEMQAASLKNQSLMYMKAASEYNDLDINVSSTPYVANFLGDLGGVVSDLI